MTFLFALIPFAVGSALTAAGLGVNYVLNNHARPSSRKALKGAALDVTVGPYRWISNVYGPDGLAHLDVNLIGLYEQILRLLAGIAPPKSPEAQIAQLTEAKAALTAMVELLQQERATAKGEELRALTSMRDKIAEDAKKIATILQEIQRPAPSASNDVKGWCSCCDSERFVEDLQIEHTTVIAGTTFNLHRIPVCKGGPKGCRETAKAELLRKKIAEAKAAKKNTPVGSGVV